MARRFQEKRRRNYTWAMDTASFTAQAAGTQAAQLFATTDVSTLMRIRGSLLSYVDTTQAPGGLSQISMGIYIVPAGSGTTVTVDPFGESSYPWLWFTSFFLGYEEYVTDVIDCPGATSFRQEIDSKSMRKLKNDEEGQIVITNTTIAGGGVSSNTVYAGRMLVMTF